MNINKKLLDNTVIVIDTSNYIPTYSEPVPFKAKVEDKWENKLLVTSLTTGKEYDLYYYQILESLDIEEIKQILNIKYE